MQKYAKNVADLVMRQVGGKWEYCKEAIVSFAAPATEHLTSRQLGKIGMNSMIYTAISFVGLLVIIVMFPILLDGIQTIWASNVTNYTGFADIVNLTPLLVWVGAVIVTAMSAYMGFKSMREGS